MLFPEELHEKIARRYQNHRQRWLTGEGKWPLVWHLDMPTESDAMKQPDTVKSWMAAWQSWRGIGELSWCDRPWRSLGKQRLPEKLSLHHASDVAAWLGETTRWEKTTSRYQHFITQWPSLSACLPRYIDLLADYSSADMERLQKMLAWITTHPQSHYYPRQLPIIGIDTKWLEQRKALIADLVATLQGDTHTAMDFYRRCGLKPIPTLIRLRILDQSLRERVGGLEDISSPVHAIATLNLPAKRVFIVENLQTGLAFNDLPGSVVIMGLGYHVDVLSALPWLSHAECYYWGDLDTHGFAILNRARSHLPPLQSLLMDEATLHQHKPLWGTENKPHTAIALPQLTAPEQAVYDGLKQQRWGENVRMEQEKIDWDWAWQRINTS